MSESPFDKHNRLLAYVAPSYSKKERAEMSRKERSAFNLDLIESGWAAPFILFPNIPGELDMPMFLEAAEDALNKKRGQYKDKDSIPAFEYRMCEKLYTVTKKIGSNEEVEAKDRFSWRRRYAADMRNRVLYGPEGYMQVPMHYRIWIWPDDVRKAMGALNLTPSKALTS